ncbi:MAG: hypothetical protein GY852_02645, partial [bacterium]|nr:hypothetical protein [bacterium]
SVAAILLVLIIVLSFAYAEPKPKINPAIEAFKAHPKVVEIMQAQKVAGNHISFKSVSIATQGGVAGVSVQELIVMHISSPPGTVNPSTRSIMGTVVGLIPSMKEFKVSSFVVLKPVEETQVK